MGVELLFGSGSGEWSSKSQGESQNSVLQDAACEVLDTECLPAI